MEVVKLEKVNAPGFKDGDDDGVLYEGLTFTIEVVSNGYILYWEEIEDGESFQRKAIFSKKEELLEDLTKYL